MRNLFLISDNPLAENLLQEAKSYTLEAPNTKAFTAASVGQLKDNLDQESILLLDSWNSQAAKEAIAILEMDKSEQVLVVAGMNLAMVIAAISFKEDVDTLEELEKTLCAQAKASILSWRSWKG